MSALAEQLLAALRDAPPPPPPVPDDLAQIFAQVPEWTPALAGALGLPESALAALVDAGWMDARPADEDWQLPRRVRRAHPPEHIARHVMRTATRRRVLQDAAPATGEVADWGRRIAALTLDEAERPPLTLRWATLAAEVDQGQFFERLRARIDAEPDAAWIEAGRVLEAALGHGVQVAVEGAARRLTLRRRREGEAMRLARCVPRQMLIDALDRLLAAGPSWATHFLGEGGSGKSIWAAQATARVREVFGGTTATVDFDHLDPDYPLRAPGLLLLHLAEELQLRDEAGASDGAFARFREMVLALHEETMGSEVSARGLDHPLMRRAVTAFAEALTVLPPPVLFALDTCEELLAGAGEGLSAAVRAMFETLEAVQKEFQPLRVILLGRRPLAAAGAEWGRPEIDAEALPPRGYLALVEVGGFTQAEVDLLLDLRAKDAPRLGESAVRDALLNAARAVDSGRYSPFAIDALAEWIADDPTVDVAGLGVEWRARYVDLRVLGRVRDAGARALLPAVVALGTFDRDALAAAAPGVSDEAFAALVGLEWIHRPTPDLYAVDAALLSDLRATLTRQRGAELRAAAARARDWLDAQPRLAPELCVVAMRLHQDDPAALRFWTRLEDRLAVEGDWARLQRVAQLLLADRQWPEERVGPVPAAAYASLLAAELNLGILRPNRRALWIGVLAGAAGDALEACRLRLRATLGMGVEDLRFEALSDEEWVILHARQSEHEVFNALLAAMAKDLPAQIETTDDPQIGAAGLALCEAIAATAARVGCPVPAEWADLHARFTEDGVGRLLAPPCAEAGQALDRVPTPRATPPSADALAVGALDAAGGWFEGAAAQTEARARAEEKARTEGAGLAAELSARDARRALALLLRWPALPRDSLEQAAAASPQTARVAAVWTA
ncbi:MAG: hypothetical protein KC620_13430, partial [Myxococcales bacterium]|nr:hypothetical protein [Myxococcales bacterium]